MSKILAFAGSTRKGSFNRMLLEVAVAGARAAGAEVTVADLAKYPMPLFNQDDEAQTGLPEGAKEFRALLGQHDGLLIAAPEYNSSITPLLKNTIDWASRPTPDEPTLKYFMGKTAALISASPGALGGLRGLVHLRAILGNIGVLVMPEQIAIPKANELFTDDGQMRDLARHAAVEALGAALTRLTDRLKA